MIVVYADETGTGGIPRTGKEPAPGICGFLATPDMWEKFRSDWNAALKAHKAPYFHFRELDRNERKDPKCFFNGWNDTQVDDFIYEMAFVASTGPIPFGGNASVKMVHGLNPKIEGLMETYYRAFNAFFDCFAITMNWHFPKEKGMVPFFFEKNRNEGWNKILCKIIKEKRKRDSRIGEYAQVESKSEIGIPCQAADLLAHINRQNNETIYEYQKYVPQRVLDIIVSRQAFPDWHPFSVLKKMSNQQWKDLISELRGRKKQFDLHHELIGTTPKPKYYPILEHSYFRQLWQLCHEHKKRHPDLWA